MQIKDSIVLITGGSSGLGKSTAKLLIGLGAKVIITGRDPQKLENVSKKIGAIGIHSSVDTDEEISACLKEVLDQFGRLDVVINNAGIGIHKPIEALTREDFERVYQTNVFGLAMMSQQAAEIFKRQGNGNIINIASTSALKGYQTGSVYASSKFAVRGLTQCLQAELRPHNVRVMLVNPSEVPTAFGRADREERPEEAKKLSGMEIAHTIVSSLAMDDRGLIPEVTVWATNPW